MPETFPYSPAMHFTVDAGFCPFNEYLRNLLGTLKCRQLPGLGIDGANDDTGGITKRGPWVESSGSQDPSRWAKPPEIP